MVAVGRSHFARANQDYWAATSERWGADFVCVEETSFRAPGEGSGYRWQNFNKFFIASEIEPYDAVLRVDDDTLPTPWAINPFTTLTLDAVWGFAEDSVLSKRRAERLQEIELVQAGLGQIGWSTTYINSGVVLLPRKFYHILSISQLKLVEVPGSFKEQNLLNWRLHSMGAVVRDFGPRWNHMRIAKPSFEERHASIIHFAGPQSEKADRLGAAIRLHWERRSTNDGSYS